MQATATGSGARLPTASAALVNGVLGHGLDFDDTHIGGTCHASAPAPAAVLARGRVDLSAFYDEPLDLPDILSIAERAWCAGDPDSACPAHFPGEMTVHEGRARAVQRQAWHLIAMQAKAGETARAITPLLAGQAGAARWSPQNPACTISDAGATREGAFNDADIPPSIC